MYQCTIFCNDIPERINVKEKICRKKIVLLYSFVISLYIFTITFTIRKLFNIECYFSKNSTNIIILDRICEMKNDVIIISEVNSLNKLTIVRKRGTSSLMVWVRDAHFSGFQFLVEKREKWSISRREKTEKSRNIIVL